jgi:hypothetical protein
LTTQPTFFVFLTFKNILWNSFDFAKGRGRQASVFLSFFKIFIKNNNLSIYLCINGKLYCLLWEKEPKQGTPTPSMFFFQFCDVAQVVIGVHKYI